MIPAVAATDFPVMVTLASPVLAVPVVDTTTVPAGYPNPGGYQPLTKELWISVYLWTGTAHVAGSFSIVVFAPPGWPQ